MSSKVVDRFSIERSVPAHDVGRETRVDRQDSDPVPDLDLLERVPRNLHDAVFLRQLENVRIGPDVAPAAGSERYGQTVHLLLPILVVIALLAQVDGPPYKMIWFRSACLATTGQARHTAIWSRSQEPIIDCSTS